MKVVNLLENKETENLKLPYRQKKKKKRQATPPPDLECKLLEDQDVLS